MKNNFSLSIVISLLISCSNKEIIKLPITTSSDEALSFYNKAMLHAEVFDGLEKRQSLDSALALDSNFVMALEMYGSTNDLIKRKHQEKAKRLSTKVTESERKRLKIRQSYRSGDMDAALKAAQWLVDNHGDSYESYLWLGQVQSDRREFDDATESLKTAISLNPDSYEAYEKLMGHHIGMGGQSMLAEEKRDVETGIKYGDQLIRIRPDAGLSYHFKANCYRQLGEFEKAKPLYEKSIEKRKGKASEGNSYNVSAHNYMFSGDFQTARKQYNLAISLAKTDWQWFLREFYLTVSYIFENDYIGAIDNINKVEKELLQREVDETTETNMIYWLSFQKMICYAHNQMEEEAYGALNKAVKTNKEYANLMNDENITRVAATESVRLNAWVNALFGKYEKARKNLESLKSQLVKLNDPTAMYGYYSLSGFTSLMEGNFKEALLDFEKGNPTDIYYNYFKALALKADGKEKDAEKLLIQIANVNFSDWDIAIVRNLAKKQLGNT